MLKEENQTLKAKIELMKQEFLQMSSLMEELMNLKSS